MKNKAPEFRKREAVCAKVREKTIYHNVALHFYATQEKRFSGLEKWLSRLHHGPCLLCWCGEDVFFSSSFLSGIFPANLGMNVWLTMQIWHGVCFNFHINNEK